MAHNNICKSAARYEQEFVISACGFTFQGYSLLLEEQGVKASHIQFDGEEVSRHDIENIMLNQCSMISVFLGRDIVNLLESLKKLASVLNELPVLKRVTLYGEIPDSWLLRTLGSLLDNKLKLSMIRVANISDIMACINDNSLAVKNCSRPLCETYSGLTSKNILKGLTKRELDILLNCYRGMTVKKQCEVTGLSDKTIYTHRKEGLKKLHQIQLWLSDLKATRMENVITRKNEKNMLSSHEMAIFNALLNKEIFPAYQVITDRYKKVVGFEILLRWNKNGKILKPASFLRDISNVEIWLKLTALVIHAAISGINKYNGKYYFSVNIPPQLASGNSLPGMAKKATEMLSKSLWSEKLVFEFAESIDVTKDSAIPKTMQRLRNTGCRLFLDDCFSSHYTMFPVRHIHFDGLKLDRDIVDNFVANDNDYNLIKAIQFYSDITGRDCVAEGVDSKEKFDKLVALGIKNFQGYYLSKAVKEDELDRMVRLFS
jgi:FOG: EAL domain